MRLFSRLRTVRQLLAHFAARERAMLLPLFVILLLAGVLLALTTGLAKVAPFVYTIF